MLRRARRAQAHGGGRLLRAAAGGRPGKELRTFGTMTEDLLALADWLRAAGCEAVAMESTGVYWKPVYNLLEGQLATVMVVNAAHIKTFPVQYP